MEITDISPKWTLEILLLQHNEGSEPPHVHVESADGEAKYWLTPVALVGSSRLKPRELRDLEWFVRLNRKFLLEAWNDFFGR